MEQKELQLKVKQAVAGGEGLPLTEAPADGEILGLLTITITCVVQ